MEQLRLNKINKDIIEFLFANPETFEFLQSEANFVGALEDIVSSTTYPTKIPHPIKIVNTLNNASNAIILDNG